MIVDQDEASVERQLVSSQRRGATHRINMNQVRKAEKLVQDETRKQKIEELGKSGKVKDKK